MPNIRRHFPDDLQCPSITELSLFKYRRPRRRSPFVEQMYCLQGVDLQEDLPGSFDRMRSNSALFGVRPSAPRRRRSKMGCFKQQTTPVTRRLVRTGDAGGRASTGCVVTGQEIERFSSDRLLRADLKATLYEPSTCPVISSEIKISRFQSRLRLVSEDHHCQVVSTQLVALGKLV